MTDRVKHLSGEAELSSALRTLLVSTWCMYSSILYLSDSGKYRGESTMILENLRLIALTCVLLASSCRCEDPTPKPWPLQFHAQTYENKTGNLAIVDLWYDWVNGRNYNIIQKQLGPKVWDVEWNNGTSYYFDLENRTCKRILFPVGLLRPDWLDNAHYLGVRTLDGFTCNVWEKVDFITYYEDVETQRPVGWLFYTGRFEHVITFEEGAVLSDPYWQAPSYCFTDETERTNIVLPSEGQEDWRRWLKGFSSLEHFD